LILLDSFFPRRPPFPQSFRSGAHL
jgi:hypothetical protein